MDDPRTYSALHIAKKAINRKGFGHSFVRYDRVMNNRVRPVVLCDNAAEVRKTRGEGFMAELKTTMMCEGATVHLKDEQGADFQTELARVESALGDAAVRLDRPLGGTYWWHTNNLVLIGREVDIV